MSIRLNSPIGIFDSGYGGLTILKEIVKVLPQYDYCYLGDNAHAPYGPKSFDTIYHLTLRSVKWLFEQGCPLVILACNTASAKALRTIQQNDLPKIDSKRRVLGVIRPITESANSFTKNNHLGIFATSGTVNSESYMMEIKKFFPQIKVSQEACPTWVPLIESNEHEKEGADFFVKQHIQNLLSKDDQIDAVILGCTHYPLMMEKIRKHLPGKIQIISQGEIVANKMKEYLQRHSEIETKCSKDGKIEFFTTDSSEVFSQNATLFFGKEIQSTQIDI